MEQILFRLLCLRFDVNNLFPTQCSYALALYLLVYKRSLVTPIGRLSRKRRIVSTTWSWSMCGYRPTTLNETNTAFSDVSPIRFKPCKKFLMSSKICGVVEVFKVEI